mmetsp:Transcript_77137/g.218287  ORF Transcript_77137/g.218287 Transcript_77137/m.218287 type:complete len:352 (-) Transcript_77137:107-1162(-)
MFQVEDSSGDNIGIAGDFSWRSPDGKQEAILRLQPGGKWWHAAHAVTAKGPLRRNLWQPADTDLKSHKDWQMAESIGSWRVEPTFCANGEDPDGVAVVLLCETCRWTSSDACGSDKPAKFRPDLMHGLHLAAMVELGQVVLPYAVRWCPTSGRPSLYLQMDLKGGHCRDESPWVAVQGLGFARSYRQSGCRAPGPQKRECGPDGAERPPKANSLCFEGLRRGHEAGAVSAVAATSAAVGFRATAAGGAAAVAASYLIQGAPPSPAEEPEADLPVRSPAHPEWQEEAAKNGQRRPWSVKVPRLNLQEASLLGKEDSAETMAQRQKEPQRIQQTPAMFDLEHDLPCGSLDGSW